MWDHILEDKLIKTTVRNIKIIHNNHIGTCNIYGCLGYWTKYVFGINVFRTALPVSKARTMVVVFCLSYLTTRLPRPLQQSHWLYASLLIYATLVSLTNTVAYLTVIENKVIIHTRDVLFIFTCILMKPRLKRLWRKCEKCHFSSKPSSWILSSMCSSGRNLESSISTTSRTWKSNNYYLKVFIFTSKTRSCEENGYSMFARIGNHIGGRRTFF